MTIEEWLRVAFDYDRWANETWQEAVGTLENQDRASSILHHIVWAQEAWLGRIGTGFQPYEGELSVRYDHVNRAWIKTLSERPLDEVISYVNSRGQAGSRKIGAVALHVIDHGTYHRGQLREIFGEQGRDDFPETGLAGFLMLKNTF